LSLAEPAEKAEDSIQKTEYRIQKTEVRRRLEGWKVRGLAINRKRKDSRIQGVKDSSGERQKTGDRRQKTEEG